MAVTINIKCDTDEKLIELREKLYSGLVGSPGYINNEIVLGELPDEENTIILIVGNGNDGDVDFDVHSENLLER